MGWLSWFTSELSQTAEAHRVGTVRKLCQTNEIFHAHGASPVGKDQGSTEGEVAVEAEPSVSAQVIIRAQSIAELVVRARL